MTGPFDAQPTPDRTFVRRIASAALAPIGLTLMLATGSAKGQEAPKPDVYSNDKWVGFCTDYGSKSAKADCSKFKEKIPPHLAELNEALVWIESIAGWKPDVNKSGDKYKYSYVDFFGEDGTGGGYSDGDIIFPQLAMIEDSNDAIAKYTAHELFHAFQQNSKLISVFRSSTGSVNNACDQNQIKQWIREGTAEAISLIYLDGASLSGSQGPVFSSNYAIPINKSQNCGYDRGEFWYAIDILLRTEKPGSFIISMHQHELTGFDFETHGADWLNGVLLEKGSSLRNAMADLISKRALSPNNYAWLGPISADGRSAPGVGKFVPRDLASGDEEMTDAMTVQPIAARAIKIVLTPELMAKPADKEFPGQRLVFQQIKIDPVTEKRVGMAVSTEWLDRGTFARYYVPLGVEIEQLTRGINVDPDKPATTERADVSFGVTAHYVDIEAPKCIAVGDTAEMDIVSVGKGAMPPMVFKASRGSFNGATYTAPATPGPETLSVEAYTTATGKAFHVFSKFDVTKGDCGMRITMSGGEMLYDGISDSSKVTGNDPELSPAYYDGRGTTIFDDERGWGLLRWDTQNAMLAPMMGATPFSQMFINPTPDAQNKPHRLAPNIVALLDKVRKTMVQASGAKIPGAVGLIVKSTGACIHGGGTCTIWTITGEGGGTLYYDANSRLRAFRNDEETLKIDYGYFPVTVPASTFGF